MKSQLNALPVSLQQQVDALRSRLNLAVFLSAFVAPLLTIFVVYAGLLIFAKMTGQSWAAHTWGILLLTVPVAAGVFYWVKREGKFFDETETVQWLDRLMKTDGWLSTAYEDSTLAQHPDFLNRLANPGADLKWRYGFFLRRLAPVLVILAAALLIPGRNTPPQTTMNPAAILSSASQKLEETSVSLTQAERESFEERLEQLTRRTDAINSESWEAISALEDDLERSAKRNENQDKALANTASQINDLINQAEVAQSAEAANVIDQQLTDMAEKLAKQAMEQASADGLTSASAETSGARIAELAKKMRAKEAPNKKQMQSLRDELKKQCDGMCKGDKPSSGSCSSSGSSAGGEEEGGSSLSFRELEDSAGKATEKPLQNEFLAAEDFAPAGVLRVQPKADPGKFEPATVRQFDEVQGNRVARTRIRPSEQAVVQRYFQDEGR